MIVSLHLFAPWRIWPVEHDRLPRLSGNEDQWYIWHVFWWLFLRIEVRGHRYG